MITHSLSGIYAAAVTPLKMDFNADLEATPQYLSFLAKRGCHGALLLGTTGEGPSFAMPERLDIFRAALEVQQEHPEFLLLAGTGTPSLTETISLTKAAFDLGYSGVVTLPPYYFHQATTDGLYNWFEELITRAVPQDGCLFGYHIPAQSGVGLPLDLIAKLKDAFPDKFTGIKDSSADPQLSIDLGQRFGNDLVVLSGNDAQLSHSLENHGSGCITAMANLYSPDLRTVWDKYKRGESGSEAQERLTDHRDIIKNYSPFPPTIKALLAEFHNFPHWSVRPPLLPLPDQTTHQAASQLILYD